MTKRSLALAFVLLASASVQAAPQKKKHAAAPPHDPTAQGAAPQEIDVDAMARAKDGKPTEPLSAPTDAAAPDSAVAADDAAAAAAPVEGSTTNPASAAPAAEDTTPAPTSAGADAEHGHSAAAAEAPTTTEAALPPQGGSQTERPSPLAPPPPPTAAEKSLAAGCEARATALLDAAQKGDFANATRDFDATMRGAMPPAKLRQAWESLAQFGRLQARGQSHPMTSDGYVAITIPLIFDKANLYAQVACGSDGRIAGFYVKPL